MKLNKSLIFVYLLWFAIAVMCTVAPFVSTMHWLFKAAVWATGGGNILGFLLNWKLMASSVKEPIEEKKDEDTVKPKTQKTTKKKGK